MTYHVQGKLLTWENTMQLDLGWKNLIYNYKMSPSLLKFHLNSIHDVAHTPAKMSLWNMDETGHCSLRTLFRRCNIKNIFAVGNFSLNNKRFNWRHDYVLKVIAMALLDQIGKFNREEIERHERSWTCFRSSKGTYRKLDYKIRREIPLVDAKDWKLTVSCTVPPAYLLHY